MTESDETTTDDARPREADVARFSPLSLQYGGTGISPHSAMVPYIHPVIRTASYPLHTSSTSQPTAHSLQPTSTAHSPQPTANKPYRQPLTRGAEEIEVVVSQYLLYSYEYCTLRYGTVQYSAERYSTVQYSTVQYSTVLTLPCTAFAWYLRTYFGFGH